MLTDNTIYKLLSPQVVQFWDAIKYACIKADEIEDENISEYFNELLQALLSDKAQCFVVLDSSKVLHGIAITRIVIDKMLSKKVLHIQCLYSLSMMDNSSLQKYFNFISDFANREKCSSVTFHSRNPRVWDIAKVVNAREKYRCFIYKLGGI
jgi:hypothetical protein